MANLEYHPSDQALEAGQRSLEENEYPGRVIIIGLNATGDMALQAYALTGRSESSRNRIFIEEETGVRTAAPGLSQEEMAAVENAALIYYKAMEESGGVYVVSNGAQTGPVLDSLVHNHTLESAVKAAPTVEGINLSLYEPDTPNYTPRITGVVLNDEAGADFGLAVVRKNPKSPGPIYSIYSGSLEDLQPGIGFGVQTYNGNAPAGSALPSFDREPYAFPLGETAEETAHSIWNVLNKDNRVAVVVRSIDLEEDAVQYHIIPEYGLH